MASRSGGGITLLKGAAVLGAAAVVSKLIGTMQKIPLQNVAGDAVFGIYNAVYPLYILILFLATAGFPIVVSKFVSEQAAAGQDAEARRILKIALIVLTGTGLVTFLLLYAGADAISRLIGVEKTAPAIRSVSFALLLVPIMSALRGYHQGYHDMVPTAVSQVVEQFVRVVTMFSLLLLFMHWQYSPERIAAGATFGSVTGALAGLVVMLMYWRKERAAFASRKGAEANGEATGNEAATENVGLGQSSGMELAGSKGARASGGAPGNEAATEDVGLGQSSGMELAEQKGQRSAAVPAGESCWRIVRRLAAYALPVCLGSIAMPILTLVDTFTMPRLLVQRLGDEAAALYQFGLYNHGIPLVQLVAMIASSMSAAIVPAVADAKWKGDTAGIKRRTESSLRLTWYVGLAASFGLAVLAEPMNVMFFKSAEGSSAMAILGFTALFSTLNIIAGSVLQGSGAIVAPAVYLLVAAALKVAGNALLMPRYGIDGAAIAAVIAYAAAGGLALAHAMRATGAEFSLRDYVYRPLGAILVMCAALVLLQRGCAALQELAAWPLRGEATVVALGGAALGALVYAAALLRVRAIGEAELRMVPKLGDKQLAALRRCRLIP